MAQNAPQQPGALEAVKTFLASTPPITRALFLCTLLLPVVMRISPPVYLYTTLTRLSDGLLAPLQPWRLFTHFFIQGIL